MSTNPFDFTRGVVPYLTLGDPNLELTEALIKSCFDHGAAAVEIGIPFSDPIADGPVIQASHQRALSMDPEISLLTGFKLIKKIKLTHPKPMIVMCAVNLVYSMGIEKFFQEANNYGVDAVVIPDLSVEEADIYAKFAEENKVALALLVSPLCTAKRMRKIIETSTGFIYLIASTGTTGARADLSKGLSTIAKTIKAIKSIPILVGFGISKPEHVTAVCEFANGAIVGSFLVKIVQDYSDLPDLCVKKIGDAISNLTGA